MSESSFDLGEGQEDLFAAMDGASLPDFADSGDMSQHYSEHEEAPEGEDGDTSVAASFYLRYNPDVTVEIRFEFLPEIQLSYEQPLQFLLGSTVDVLKKTISNHVYYTHRFTLLKRHFQMML